MAQLKRPVALAGGALLMALAVLYALNTTWLLAGILLLAGGIVVFHKSGDRLRVTQCVVALCAALFALLLWGLDRYQTDRVVHHYAGQQTVVSGYVTGTAQYGEWTLVTATLTDIQGGAERFEVTFFSDAGLEPGDGFPAHVTFGEYSSPYTDYLSMQLDIEEMLAVQPRARPLLSWAAQARRYVKDTVLGHLPNEEGAISAAIVTGDKNLIPTALNLVFNRAGVSHIIVVSGLHITLFISIVFWLGKRLRAGRVAQLILLVGIIAACILFYGPQPSVLRACVMGFLLYSGGIFLRRSDPITSLAVAAIIILVLRPSAVVNISFLLSFGCCVALTVVYPVCQRVLNRRMASTNPLVVMTRKVLDALLLSATINLVTFPLLVLAGMPIALVAPLANILVVPLATLLTVTALICCIPVAFISYLAALTSGLLAKAIIAISRFFAAWPVASVDTSPGYLKVFLIYGAALLAVCLWGSSKRLRKGLIVACVVVVLLCGILSQFYLTFDRPQIILYDEETTLFRDGDALLAVLGKADPRDLDYLADYCTRRFSSAPTYVILLTDNGRQTEQYAHAAFACPVEALYAPHLAQTAYVAGVGRQVTRVGRLLVDSWADGDFIVHYGGARLAIVQNNADSYNADFSVIVTRRQAEDTPYIHIHDGRGDAVYDTSDRVVLYLRQDGTGKAVIE